MIERMKYRELAIAGMYTPSLVWRALESDA